MGKADRAADPEKAKAAASAHTAAVLDEQAQYLRNERAMLHDMEVDKYLHDCVSVFPETINEEYVRVSADLAYWGHKWAVAALASQKARVGLKQYEAKLRLSTRERLIKAAAEGGSKVTEALLDAEVESSQLLLDERLKAAEADFEKSRLWGILDAIQGKKDMLVSLGATIRSEMASDPILREHRSEARRHGPGED